MALAQARPRKARERRAGATGIERGWKEAVAWCEGGRAWTEEG